MISLSFPRSRNTCGWSNGGLAPTHMNSCEPISMTGTPASLWKCGTTLSDIVFTWSGDGGGRNQTHTQTPAALSDAQLNSALRDNQAVIAQNIEAALAAGDADLANSLVELARDKNIPL